CATAKRNRLLRTWHALSDGRIISLSDSQLEMFIATARALPLEKRDLSAHIAKWLSLSKIFPIPARVPFVDVDTGQCRSTRREQRVQNRDGHRVARDSA